MSEKGISIADQQGGTKVATFDAAELTADGFTRVIQLTTPAPRAHLFDPWHNITTADAGTHVDRQLAGAFDELSTFSITGHFGMKSVFVSADYTADTVDRLFLMGGTDRAIHSLNVSTPESPTANLSVAATMPTEVGATLAGAYFDSATHKIYVLGTTGRMASIDTLALGSGWTLHTCTWTNCTNGGTFTYHTPTGEWLFLPYNSSTIYGTSNLGTNAAAIGMYALPVGGNYGILESIFNFDMDDGTTLLFIDATTTQLYRFDHDTTHTWLPVGSPCGLSLSPAGRIVCAENILYLFLGGGNDGTYMTMPLHLDLSLNEWSKDIFGSFMGITIPGSPDVVCQSTSVVAGIPSVDQATTTAAIYFIGGYTDGGRTTSNLHLGTVSIKTPNVITRKVSCKDKSKVTITMALTPGWTVPTTIGVAPVIYDSAGNAIAQLAPHTFEQPSNLVYDLNGDCLWGVFSWDIDGASFVGLRVTATTPGTLATTTYVSMSIT